MLSFFQGEQLLRNFFVQKFIERFLDELKRRTKKIPRPRRLRYFLRFVTLVRREISRFATLAWHVTRGNCLVAALEIDAIFRIHPVDERTA